MSGNLHQIAQADRHLPEPMAKRLQALYDEIPGVSCHCDHLGQCCELTEEEAADDWATMYPLYPVEYLNIVDYVESHFDASRRDELLGLTDERPMRCPFLTGEGGCSIHPARPLACRTYGVLSQDEILETREQFRGELPTSWLNQFVRNESCAVCTHTERLEPEKVSHFRARMAAFEYERALIDMGREEDGLDDARREVLRSVSGKERVLRWTWGGFNAVWRKPVSWLKQNLSEYLDASSLGE